MDISVIGAGVVDVLVGTVDEKIFSRGSTPVDFVTTSFGGDALNEAVILSRFGKRVQWVSKVGDDDAGQRILRYAQSNGIDVSHVTVRSGLSTAVNIVLVDAAGERRFLTNPRSSLRNLTAEDILPHVDEMASIVSFASLFVSTALDISATEKIFARIKSTGRTLTADTTRPKHGETLSDIAGLLKHVDYFFPNETELAALTGSTDVDKNISALLDCGLKCAVVKRGGKGCVIAHGDERLKISACPVEQVVDTTGAGDSFAAGFLFALSEGQPLVECVKFASATASCSVEQVGAVTGVTSLAKVSARFENYSG